MEAPPLPPGWPDVQKIRTDEKGKDIGRRPLQVCKFNLLGQGYPIDSYRPLDAGRRQRFVQWSCTLVQAITDPAVAGILTASRTDKAMFHFEVDNELGAATWT